MAVGSLCGVDVRYGSRQGAEAGKFVHPTSTHLGPQFAHDVECTQNRSLRCQLPRHERTRVVNIDVLELLILLVMVLATAGYIWALTKL